MDEVPPPLLTARCEPLLRGPLILTAISRVLTVVFYAVCGLGSSKEIGFFFGHFSHYSPLYIADKLALVGIMWSFLLLSVLLAWLFFSRRRIFRPVMIYFSTLLILLFVGVAVHTHLFPPRHKAHVATDSSALYVGCIMLVSAVFWPCYYTFSSRVKRVFTR